MDKPGQAADAVVNKTIFLLFGPEALELLSFSLERRYHCKTTACSEITSAIQSLKAPFDLAVLDSTFPDWMIAFERVREAKIPFALYHPEAQSPEVRGPKIKSFKENELLGAVFKAMEEIQAAPKSYAGTAEGPPFAAVATSLLLKTNPQVSDLYICLSSLKFVKLVREGDTFSPEDEKKYRQKKVGHLFIRHDSLEKLVARINAMLEKQLKQKRPKKEAAPTTVETVEVMHELIKQVGFTPEVQKLVKNNMNLVIKEMQESPSLSGILSNMERNKDKYIAAHSQILAEVSCALAIAMEWGSDTSLKKIAMASLLHDMSINDQKLCRVKDMQELEARKAEFDSSQIDEYTSHPRRAALLIQGMKEVPADVDKIVYQHHELPRGNGFPEAIGHIHIHPLAATLMVSHDLVDWLIDHPGPPDMVAFTESLGEKYQQGVFKKIIKKLQDLKL